MTTPNTTEIAALPRVYNPLIPLGRYSTENPWLDTQFRAIACTPAERFLSLGSNRAAVALAAQRIVWAAPGGRFAHVAEAQELAEAAVEWLSHHGLDAKGKPLPMAA